MAEVLLLLSFFFLLLLLLLLPLPLPLPLPPLGDAGARRSRLHVDAWHTGREQVILVYLAVEALPSTKRKSDVLRPVSINKKGEENLFSLLDCTVNK